MEGLDPQDLAYMRMAIEMARQCRLDRPESPKVGAVAVLEDGRVVTAFRGERVEGYGGPQSLGDHAEFTLLEKKLHDAKLVGATIYATLEPCTTERTPPKIPCAFRLRERGVRKVWIGMLDPNPRIQGHGQRLLAKARIEIGVFPAELFLELQEINRDFIRAQEARARTMAGDDDVLGTAAPAPKHKRKARPSLALPIDAWVRSRWPDSHAQMRGRRPLYPTWAEFEAGKVYIPERFASAVREHLARRRVALVTGRPGSGKSVFGVSIGHHWLKHCGPAFYIDLRDSNDYGAERIQQLIDGFAAVPGDGGILIVDNAHASDRIARDLLEEAERLPSSHLLFLSRPNLVAAEPTVARALDLLGDVEVTFECEWDSFRGTALRLSGGTGPPAKWADPDYAEFCRDFGGNLIAFSQAVLEVLDGAQSFARPSRRSAAQYIRSGYLDVADKHPKGRDTLLAACAIGSLDFTCTEMAIEAPPRVALPDFVRDGIIREIRRGQWRHWSLPHPSLCEMILEVHAFDRGRSMPELRMSLLQRACEQDRHLLGFVTWRLWTRQYVSRQEWEEWERMLSSTPALLRSWMIEHPGRFQETVRFAGLRFDLSILDLPLLERDLRPALLRTAPQYVQGFLRYLDEKNRAARAGDILDALVEGNDYLARLQTAPPNHAAAFLRYMAQKKRGRRAGEMLDALLKGDQYRRRLKSTRASGLIAFLQYLDQRNRDDAECGATNGNDPAGEVLDGILDGDDYLACLKASGLNHVVTFLRYVDNKNRERRARELLDAFLESDDYFERLKTTAASHIVSLLRYLDEKRDSRADHILDALVTRDGYLAGLLPRDAITCLQYLDEKSGGPPQHDDRAGGRLDALVQGDEYLPRLKTTPPDEVVTFLHYLDDKKRKRRAAEILDSILADDDYLARVKTSPPSTVVMFLEYLDEKKRDGRAGEILDDLLNNDGYRRLLATARLDALASLSSYVEERTGLERARVRLYEVLSEREVATALAEQAATAPLDQVCGFLGHRQASAITVAQISAGAWQARCADLGCESLDTLNITSMALVAHGRTDLALPLASAAIEPSRFDEWRHGYRLRTLGYIAAPLLTAYPAQLEQFLSAVVDERWLRQQMRQSTTAALAGAAFALWGALDARLLRNVRDPLMAELGDPRRHDSATDPAGAAGLSLLGAASLFGALPPPHVAAVYARRNLDAILRGRVLESRSETPTVLELQALLGLRAIALRSPASVRLQAEVGEAALRRLTANDGAHTKSRHLNKLLVAWLQRCAAAGWIALADAAPVPE